MSSSPQVSVVLPVHNGAAHVSEAIASILAQTFDDFELVICDDGSNDGTSDIIAALASADPRCRIERRESRSGVAAAANWAVSMARAPLVAIAHADDFSHPDRLKQQVAIMQAQADCVLTGAPAASIDWNGEVAHPVNLWRLAYPGPFAPFAHSSIMFRREAVAQVGGYRSGADYWEDLDLYWRLARLGRILVTPMPLTTYRYSRISIRQRDADLMVERSLETMYCAAEKVAVGAEPELLGIAPERQRIHPRIFVASSWSRVWAGERAIVLGKLLERGDLKFDRQTLESLGFVLWATVSPKSLRSTLRIVTRLRNRLALKRLGKAETIEWDPHRAHRNG